MKIEVYPEKYRRRYFKIIQEQTELFFKNRPINPQTVVSFNFVSKAKIQTLNRQYRRLNKPTDVLSFPIWQNLAQVPKKGAVNLGDIFISLGVLKESAQEKNLDFNEVLKKIITHSLNHLVGKHH